MPDTRCPFCGEARLIDAYADHRYCRVCGRISRPASPEAASATQGRDRLGRPANTPAGAVAPPRGSQTPSCAC